MYGRTCNEHFADGIRQFRGALEMQVVPTAKDNLSPFSQFRQLSIGLFLGNEFTVGSHDQCHRPANVVQDRKEASRIEIEGAMKSKSGTAAKPFVPTPADTTRARLEKPDSHLHGLGCVHRRVELLKSFRGG